MAETDTIEISPEAEHLRRAWTDEVTRVIADAAMELAGDYDLAVDELILVGFESYEEGLAMLFLEVWVDSDTDRASSYMDALIPIAYEANRRLRPVDELDQDMRVDVAVRWRG